jgi:hypothetical protein
MSLAHALARRAALAAECRRLRRQIGHDDRALRAGLRRWRESWAWAHRLFSWGRLLGRLTGR